MKCLTIRQPWAELIIRGDKDVENRGVRFIHRGPLLIHAGKRMDDEALAMVRKRTALELPLALGCIVGIVTVIDCVPGDRKHRKSEWHQEGSYGLYLRDARRFNTPVPLTGRLGLFEVDDKLVADAIRRCGYPTGGL